MITVWSKGIIGPFFSENEKGCGFWSSGIIGPFFFENEHGEAVTVNGDRYRAMLNEFLFTNIVEEVIGNI